MVYKIDRLTRSLMDFAKLVERFDKANCSFVSVTQAFNTSTSMGRLTLNVLLSFAQFEREVTAERIRDKIAASKKKGMWMGGVPPIGYTPKDRELVIDPDGAALVRKVFDLYLDLKCLSRLKREADRLGLRTRPSRPTRNREGMPYSRGHLHAMLTNPIYVGEIPHKTQRYPGRHQAIIDRQTWDRVQAILQSRSLKGRGEVRRTANGSPLAGRVFDETGDRLTPTYTTKSGRRLRYYVSHRLIDRTSTRKGDRSGWRLPAGQLEEAVAGVIANTLRETKPEDIIRGDVEGMRQIEMTLRDLTPDTGAGTHLFLDLVEKVRVTPGCLEVAPQPAKLAGLLGLQSGDLPDRLLNLSAPFQRRRRGVESKLIFGYQAPAVDPVLLRRVARGWAWWEEMRTGKASRADIARRENVSPRFISMHVETAFLAPDIIAAIIDGRHPKFLSAQTLRVTKLSSVWTDQRHMLECQRDKRSP